MIVNARNALSLKKDNRNLHHWVKWNPHVSVIAPISLNRYLGEEIQDLIEQFFWSLIGRWQEKKLAQQPQPFLCAESSNAAAQLLLEKIGSLCNHRI